jgi:8-oxo-dGTP pyrophosphatase MutT (NUDIX family)
MTPNRAVRLWIHREDGQLLVVNRRQNPNLLCMPGGKVDPGETLEQAAARELAEETGLRVPSSALRVLFTGTVRNDQATDTAAYEVTTFHVPWQAAWGSPQDKEANIHPRWVSPETFAQQCAAPDYDHAVLAAWEAHTVQRPRRRPR